MSRNVIAEAFAEKGTIRFTGTVKDDAGVALPGASLNTLTLTLSNKVDGAIINTRNGTDILNVNGGTVDASGNWILVLDANDAAIIDTKSGLETRIALIEWTYGAGKTGKHEIEFSVRNLSKVT